MTATAATDRFGNPVDAAVGYARGHIIRGSFDELRRRAHALALLRSRVESKGRDSIYNFTGHHREFIARSDDIAARLAEEWVGQSMTEPELVERARTHMGAAADSTAAVFNRSSACIVALLLAIAPPGTQILSIAPKRRSHVSVRRGAQLAGAKLIEVDPSAPIDWTALTNCPLVLLTRVTSELDLMPTALARSLIDSGRAAGMLTFVDDAYGAQLCPHVLGDPRTMELGAHASVTSCDKAGLLGPRAGLMVGEPEIVQRVLAKASEIGLEGRAVLALGVLQALRSFDAAALKEDCQVAKTLVGALAERLGAAVVQSTIMGPTISEEDVLAIALERAGLQRSPLVPAEATCILAMDLMEEHGFLTSNVAERPGARVSLRLRALARDIARFGGVQRVAVAIDSALTGVRRYLSDPALARMRLIGA